MSEEIKICSSCHKAVVNFRFICDDCHKKQRELQQQLTTANTEIAKLKKLVKKIVAMDGHVHGEIHIVSEQALKEMKDEC